MSYDEWMEIWALEKEQRSKPHKMRFRIRGGWSSWKKYPTYHDAHLDAERKNDGSLSWEDFEICRDYEGE